MAVSVDASEVKVLAVELGKVPANVEARTRTAVAKVGADMTARMQIDAAVDTGAMQSSTTFDLSDGGMEINAGPTVDYARYVEYGTSKMAAQPFVNPAMDRGVEQLVAALGKIAGGALG